jgi:hypothetical protein
VVESFGVEYVWVMAAVLTFLAALTLVRIPPNRPTSEDEQLPAAVAAVAT